MDVLGALSSSGIFIFVAVFAVFAAIVWLIHDVITRQDLSAGMKAVWIILAFLFSIGTLLVYALFFRRKGHSAT
jgi:hypothetical protein